jgi:hypothetical protein
LDRRSGEFPRILASDWFKRGRGIAWKEEQRNVTEAKQTRQLFDAGGRARRPTKTGEATPRWKHLGPSRPRNPAGSGCSLAGVSFADDDLDDGAWLQITFTNNL